MSNSCKATCTGTCKTSCTSTCSGCSSSCQGSCTMSADTGILTDPDWLYDYSVNPKHGATKYERLQKYRETHPQSEEDRQGNAFATPKANTEKIGRNKNEQT